MALNLGLDFGTTYSLVSKISKQNDNEPPKPEKVKFNDSQEDVFDSIVVKEEDGTLHFGNDAKDYIGTEGYESYRGFKMMLNETNPRTLSDKKYDDNITPKRLVTEYLDTLLDGCLCNSFDEAEEIDKLVFGVPYKWYQESVSVDSGAILKEIIEKDLDSVNVKKAEAICEPILACAYFAYNYEINKGKKYEGNMLVIDYGGGTLDITLCKISCVNGKNVIKPLVGTGEGFNTEGVIGSGGLAFMQTVAKLAIGLDKKKDYDDDEDFQKTLKEVERAIRNSTSDINNHYFRSAKTESKRRLKKSTPNALKKEVTYKKNKYAITYKVLEDAYSSAIEKVLKREIDKIKLLAIENREIGIDLNKPVDSDNLKIALVGGFCRFALTKKQILEEFDASDDQNDVRFRSIDDSRFDMKVDVFDMENAISYGAALIANGAVEYEQVAPYSIGFSLEDKNIGNNVLNADIHYVIKKGTTADNKPHFVRNNYEAPANDLNGCLSFIGRNIPNIVLNYSDDIYSKTGYVIIPSEQFKNKFTIGDERQYYIGFSIDNSLVLSIYKWPLKSDNPNDVERLEGIRIEKILSIGNLNMNAPWEFKGKIHFGGEQK